MKRLLFCLSFAFLCLSCSIAQTRSYNIVFIGNSITFGAIQKKPELTAPPVKCGQWLSQQEGIDTVYIKNCGRSGLQPTISFLVQKMLYLQVTKLSLVMSWLRHATW